MVLKSDQSYRSETTSIRGGQQISAASLFGDWNRRRNKAQSLKNMLDSSDFQLEDVGLSRATLVEALGHDPVVEKETRTAFVLPNLYLGIRSAISSHAAFLLGDKSARLTVPKVGI